MYERLRRLTHGPRQDIEPEPSPAVPPSDVLRALLAVTVAATHAETGDLLGLICQELGTARSRADGVAG